MRDSGPEKSRKEEARTCQSKKDARMGQEINVVVLSYALLYYSEFNGQGMPELHNSHHVEGR
jgi:hypothetical protein